MGYKIICGGDILKKYRLGYQPYLAIILTFLIVMFIFKLGVFGFVAYILCTPLIILQLFNLIDIRFFIYIGIDGNGIVSKTLKVNNYIEWNNIQGVYSYDAGTFLYRYSIIITDTSKSIKISNWIKNSKELIKLVVSECKKRDIKIDPKIEKIIE